MIDIKGMTPASVLAALYNAAKSQGVGMMFMPPLTPEGMRVKTRCMCRSYWQRSTT